MNLQQIAQKISQAKQSLTVTNLVVVTVIAGSVIYGGVTYVTDDLTTEQQTNVCDDLRGELEKVSITQKVEVLEALEELNCQ